MGISLRRNGKGIREDAVERNGKVVEGFTHLSIKECFFEGHM